MKKKMTVKTALKKYEGSKADKKTDMKGAKKLIKMSAKDCK